MKISVIIPAYNCANYVLDTIRSIKQQTLTDYEVIMINDGSTDNTLSILEEVVSKDNRFKVITVDNAGPANARNVGMMQAEGEYLYFMDSDDLILPDMFQDMYSTAIKNSLDVVACGYTMENISTSKPHIKEFLYQDFFALDEQSFRKELMNLIKAHLMYVVWNKLFRKDFIKEHNITFINFLSGEDRTFNTHTFKHIKKFGFINKPYYRYFLRGQQTLANRYVVNRFESALSCHKDLIQSYKDMGLYNQQNKDYIDFIFIKGVMSCFTQLNSKGCKLSYKEKRNQINTILNNQYVKDALQSSDNEIGYSKTINKILKSNNKTLIYLTSKAIFMMQFKWNNIYLNIKHKLK